MFPNENSISTIRQLFAELKNYLELQKEYTKTEATEKLTILLSTLILVLLAAMLGMMALFYMSFTLAFVLAPAVGGLIGSFGLIAAFHALLLGLLVRFRKPLIVTPVLRLIAKLFLDKQN